MLGCSYHCAFCQNWTTSRAPKDVSIRTPVPGSKAEPDGAGGPKELSRTPVQRCSPKDLVRLAKQSGSAVVTSTYNEPLITSEWAVAVFREAKKAGLRCAFVSNGGATTRVLKYLKPWLDFYKVDLKGFNDRRYRRILGGVLSHVLRSIEDLVALGFWTEVVTLVIPGINDSDEELRSIARFLAGVSKDLPWHVTAFHGDYQMSAHSGTPPETLVRAAGIGKAEGLRYVYAGNLPGKTQDLENTSCPGCREALIRRSGFQVLSNRIQDGRCPSCRTPIPGVWA